MRGEDKTGNIDHTARLALLIALTVLTVVLIVENLLLGWEGWMLPVLGVGIVAAWALMIFNILPGETIHITSLDPDDKNAEKLTFTIEKGNTSHQFDAALSEAAPAEVTVD